MAGTFTHFTAVFCLYSDRTVLNKFSKEHRIALARYNQYCELGAVSPDYPYLKITSKSGAFWANTMHHKVTGDFVRVAIPLISRMNPGDDKNRCLAWLFGFVSHLVADMTIHPVITLKVGPYEQNKTPHRHCEMNQDAYIQYQRRKIEITSGELLKTGICACVNESRQLLPCLVDLWKAIFMELKITRDGSSPRPGTWHRSFVFLHDKIAEEGRFFPISRHYTDKHALTYPEVNKIEDKYIEALKTPKGVMHFDDLFDYIVSNILAAWVELDAAIGENDSAIFKLPNGDLDSGLADGKSVYWGKKK